MELFVFAFVAVAVIAYALLKRESSKVELKVSKPLLEVPLKDLAIVWLSKDSEEKSPSYEISVPETTSSTSDSVYSITQGFYKDNIEPYVEDLKAQDAFDLVVELVELMEKFGGCPSVVASGFDKESTGVVASVKDTLAKVTLREHTYQVVSLLLKFVKDLYVDWRFQVPKALLVGLAHDIGKIPEFHLGHYSSWEHPLIGEQKLMEIVTVLREKGKPVPVWIDTVREAIREHHLPKVRGQLTELLKRADRESRTLELARHMKEYKISLFNEWFKVGELLRKLEPLINVTQTNKWCAVTSEGIVYVRPECLWELVNQLREEKKILDSLFLYTDETETVLQAVSIQLKQSGIYPSFVKEGYYGVKCKVFTDVARVTGKHQQQLLIPLRLDLVAQTVGANPVEIESRKSGVMQVLNIEPILK